MARSLPWRIPRTNPWLTVVALAAASTSGAAIVLHALSWLPMYFFVDVTAAPALVLLLVVGVLAHRIEDGVLLNRLWVGLPAGLAATLAYDGIRYLLLATGIIGFDPFKSHPIFGMLITGQPVTTTTSILVGWTYHLWNGISFAIIYTLVAGRAHWGYAIAWALLLEVAWVTAMPSVVEIGLTRDLVIVGIVGHGAYGLALAGVARRWIRR